jgi:hypothetical protein
MAFKLITTLTPRETAFLHNLKLFVPKPFLNTCDDPDERDEKLLYIAKTALADYNNMPPYEGYTINSLPPDLEPIIIMATNYFIMVLRKEEYSLIDLSYSDNGLSVTLDRVGKIGAAIDSMKELYLRILQNRKNVVVLQGGGMGLRTARYQSNFSRFVGMLGTGGAFGWGMP